MNNRHRNNYEESAPVARVHFYVLLGLVTLFLCAWTSGMCREEMVKERALRQHRHAAADSLEQIHDLTTHVRR